MGCECCPAAGRIVADESVHPVLFHEALFLALSDGSVVQRAESYTKFIKEKKANNEW